MPTFTDTAGREWTVALDGLLLKSLRDAHGIDLADVLSAQYVQLERDPALLTTALAHLLRDQLAKQGVTAEQLAAALRGPCLESAFAALWGAAEGFFPPKLWRVLSSLYEQQTKQTEIKTQLAALGLIDSLPPEIREAIYAEIGRQLPNFDSLISAQGTSVASASGETPPTSASSSPVSSESTPAG